ncbi:MAG: hypothetical protein CL780_02915 [Chloroflexi bacterium]|nr:hypothetical protein [Chloroflexota bacterium]
MNNSQVFYRKWRPKIFKEIVGQEHITKTLQKAIVSERIAHAYLLTGPRGVGKTSTARILAKALNSEISSLGEPLNNSDISQAIDTGSFLDLIEIDGASNRGIDDIRSLRDSTQFKPSLGKYKIYIIDEVHMLTIPAFNALLKTLEEPPEKVVFILCTTDAEKIPSTIISRCQRFDFKRLLDDDLIGRLIEICNEENIQCEPSVLELISRQSGGSLRDAENMLEQLSISFSETNQENSSEITESQARKMFGMVDKSVVINFCAFLLNSDLKACLELVNIESEKGADLQKLFLGSIDILRLCLLKKANVETEIITNFEVDSNLLTIINDINVNHILKILQFLVTTKPNNNLSSPIGFELTILNALKRENEIQNIPSNIQEQQKNLNQDITKNQISLLPNNNKKTSQEEKIIPPSNKITEEKTTEEKTTEEKEWEEILWMMRRTRNHKYTIGSLLRNTEIPKINNGKISLRFKSKSILDLFKEEMSHPKSKNELRKAIEKIYSQSLEIELRAPKEAGTESSTLTRKETPIVRQALSLGGKILSEESISPNQGD